MRALTFKVTLHVEQEGSDEEVESMLMNDMLDCIQETCLINPEEFITIEVIK